MIDLGRFRTLLAMALLGGLASSQALAFNGYVEVTNHTGYDIYRLYVSNEHSDDWEEDVLGSDILSDGDTVRVTVRKADSEYFDIRAEDEDGDTYTLWHVDISSEDVTFTLGDIDTQQTSGTSDTSAASSFDGYVKVTNQTGYAIYYLYVSHQDSKDWEEDVLGDDILFDGRTVRVDVTGAPSEYFDIRAEDEDGDTYTLWNVDISTRDVTFTLDDLD